MGSVLQSSTKLWQVYISIIGPSVGHSRVFQIHCSHQRGLSRISWLTASAIVREPSPQATSPNQLLGSSSPRYRCAVAGTFSVRTTLLPCPTAGLPLLKLPMGTADTVLPPRTASLPKGPMELPNRATEKATRISVPSCYKKYMKDRENRYITWRK